MTEVIMRTAGKVRRADQLTKRARQKVKGRKFNTGIAPIVAGVLSVLAGIAGLLASRRGFDLLNGYTQFVIALSLGSLLVGGAVCVLRIPYGMPIAIGGAPMLIAAMTSLLGRQLESGGALSTNLAKYQLAGGVLAVLVVAIGCTCLYGKSNRPLGMIIVIASVVAWATTFATGHIDDVHDWATIGLLVGGLSFVIVISVGARSGTHGVIASIIAGSVLLPSWVDIAWHDVDRRPFWVVGAAADAIVVLVALVAVAMLLRKGPVVSEGTGPVATIGITAQVATTSASAVARASTIRTTGSVPAVAASAGVWAADPDGRYDLRFWDGAAWTEHVSTRGVQTVDPVG